MNKSAQTTPQKPQMTDKERQEMLYARAARELREARERNRSKYRESPLKREVPKMVQD